jgi:hypothetical protein
MREIMNWYKVAKEIGCRIGVVGFSKQDFDRDAACSKIKEAFDTIANECKQPMSVVSGLTNLGIPALAYNEAFDREWKTVGIACSKANDFDIYPCDETIIVGDEWGDESDKFLSSIDILVRVGGGKQSKDEVKMAKERGLKVMEFDL